MTNEQNQSVNSAQSGQNVIARSERRLPAFGGKQSLGKQQKVDTKRGFFKKKECKECEKLKMEMEEYKIGWQRALADYKNLQKETTARLGEWAQMSERQILEEFIPVYDHLKLAISAKGGSSSGGNEEQLANNNDPWLVGVRLVAKQFAD
ncbi:MAG: nucleotide exchange factor GrpE, partial [bacterium]